ncbi:MAG: ABC-ATPase domain-containing protein [Myxococcota bacterium]
MPSLDDLAQKLRAIDRKSYGAYKSIKGAWTDGPLTLVVEHVQGDPFAAPSTVHVRLAPERHGIPAELFEGEVRRVALTDFLLRVFAERARHMRRVGGSGKSGQVQVDEGDAEVLARAGCAIDAEGLELRFRVGLPARGRNVLGRAAAELLCEAIPRAARGVCWNEVDQEAARAFVLLTEDHAHLQAQLAEHGLVAFVRDGSILPRESGVSSHPLQGAVPFRGPESLRVRLQTRHHGEVEGMGLPRGVTLVTGGGFHGKTTLLEAIQSGVHPHVPGDGREWVATDPDAVKVRSEDGRSVAGMDLRPFIRDLPGDRDTAWFDTPDASGSTSLAAAILEAAEAGARCLLLDEDTCATNLLIRDARMQALVQRETIVPLIDRVRELHDQLGISTLIVLGGSGDYLDVADRVLLLEEYVPREETERAAAIAGALSTGRRPTEGAAPLQVPRRHLRAASFEPRPGRRQKIRARGLRELQFGDETIDLSALEQLVADSQARAIGVLLRELRRSGDGQPLRQAVEAVITRARTRGLRTLDPAPELALPRAHELAAAVNRLRSLRVSPARPEPAAE